MTFLRRAGVAAALATATLVAAVAPAGAGTLDITVDPDPPVANAPVSFTVSATGCPASTFVLIYLSRINSYGDTFETIFMDEAYVETDADGAVTATFDEPRAYPGTWGATSTACGASVLDTVTIAPGADQVAAVTPATFTAGDTVTVAGRACFGVRVEYGIVSDNDPLPFAVPVEGSAVPAGDGTWTGTLATDADLASGPANLFATCVYEPTLLVQYDAVPVTVEAAPVTVPPTPPVVVTPRFTG